MYGLMLLCTPHQLMEIRITKTLKLGESLIKLVYATRNLVGILVIIRFFSSTMYMVFVIRHISWVSILWQ